MLRGNQFVLSRMPKKAGRKPRMHLQFAGGLTEQLLAGRITNQVFTRCSMRLRDHADNGVAQDRQIRPRTDGLCFDSSWNIAILRTIDQRRHQVATRGKTHHAHPIRLDLPQAGTAAENLHRFDRILKLRWVSIAGGSQSIAEQEDGDALLVEPSCERLSLSFIDPLITPPRDEQHRASVGLIRAIQGEGGDILGRFSSCARCSVRPHRKRGDGTCSHSSGDLEQKYSRP